MIYRLTLIVLLVSIIDHFVNVNTQYFYDTKQNGMFIMRIELD